MTKLSNDDVARMRALRATGTFRQTDLADMFGVAQATVSLIVRGLRRREAGGPIETVQRAFTKEIE